MPEFRELPLLFGVWPVPGEALRYHVQSQSRREIRHLVDLEDLGFNGCCGCESFQMRHLPALKQDRREGEPPRRRRCWHIKRALEFHAELSARIIARHNNKKAVA